MDEKFFNRRQVNFLKQAKCFFGAPLVAEGLCGDFVPVAPTRGTSCATRPLELDSTTGPAQQNQYSQSGLYHSFVVLVQLHWFGCAVQVVLVLFRWSSSVSPVALV